MKPLVMGVTGASGLSYARRLAQFLSKSPVDLHLIVSPTAQRLMSDELGVKDFSLESFLGYPADNITLYEHDDLAACIASGSYLTNGMVVCPCSSHTLAGIAGGLGDNLITRAALVTLKEARRLVLVPRETPLSLLELENMVRLGRAGAVICPACPGFYMQPRSIEDLIDFVVGRVLDLFDLPHQLGRRWQ